MPVLSMPVFSEINSSFFGGVLIMDITICNHLINLSDTVIYPESEFHTRPVTFKGMPAVLSVGRDLSVRKKWKNPL